MKKILVAFFCIFITACTGAITTTPTASSQNQISTPASTREISTPDREKTTSFFQTEISQQSETKGSPPSPLAIGEDPGSCKEDYIPGEFSPDESWLTCFTPFDLYLIGPDGSELSFNPPGINKTDQVYWFSPIKWSNDGRFLWIGAGETTGFSPFCFPAQPYLGLYRIDTQTGQTTSTLPFSADGYYYQFSPSGKYLAFSQNISELTVINMISGQKREFKDDNELSGAMIFSPDEENLAFSTQESSEISGCLNSKLKILDFGSGEVDTYYNDMERAPILFESWADPEYINFRVFPDTYLTLRVQDKQITNTP